MKIFLGAAPGVGKTYEMLGEGAEFLKTGTDVVAGVIETHGRAETVALLAPFEVLPRREIVHGAHRLTEFDLDAMLVRAPQVALIDELAHSNAAGSRHPKRWQDIEELRERRHRRADDTQYPACRKFERRRRRFRPRPRPRNRPRRDP